MNLLHRHKVLSVGQQVKQNLKSRCWNLVSEKSFGKVVKKLILLPALVLRKFQSVNPFNGHFCGPEPLGPVRWGKDGISISARQQNIFYSVFSQVRIIFKPVQRQCTMTVWNEPLHDMACVVICEPPPWMELETLWILTWKKDIWFGINLIVWKG